ncbi:aminotransferase class I/II-fold pyridoxal phosphate-dependent enzyme [Escherichia coli]|nr:aminotransferase class I/II-fold pyridoxal phosphate-dependent enzyme [Escherichia coli]
MYSALKKSAGGWEPDWEDFARKASQADLRVKILFLCNPHNPTGRVWRPDELKRIIEICLANDIWVISDEIHCDLSRSGIGHTPAASLSLILHALLPACPRVKHSIWPGICWQILLFRIPVSEASGVSDTTSSSLH